MDGIEERSTCVTSRCKCFSSLLYSYISYFNSLGSECTIVRVWRAEPARFRTRELSTKLSARVGDSVELPCALDGDPTPAVTWFFASADAAASTYPTQRLEPLEWNETAALPDSDTRTWQRARRIAREATPARAWPQRLWLLANHSLYLLHAERALRGQYMCIANNVELGAGGRPKPPLHSPPPSAYIYHKMTLELFGTAL